jgi:hypothetical protein
MLAFVAPGFRAILAVPVLQSENIRAGRGAVGAARVAAAPPAISISIEPAALAPYAEAESPVVFPGYLLPDDGGEVPAHAGS